MAKHELEGLLESVIVDLIFVAEYALPQFVKRAVLDKEYWLYSTLLLNDVVNAFVHLFFDSTCCPRNVIDRLCIDATLSNKLVCLELVDCSALHLFL